MRNTIRSYWFLMLALALLVGCGQPQPSQVVPAAAVPSPSPPNKLTQIADNEATRQALVARQPTRTMPPRTPPSATCPKVAQPTIEPYAYTGLKGAPNNPLAAGAEHLINHAVLAPPGDRYTYSVYAGALSDDGDQGLLIVFRTLRDPCTDKLGVDFYQHNLLTPQRRGGATITAIDGQAISFAYAQGGGARLDVETERFTDVAVPATPVSATATRTPATVSPGATPRNP